MEYWNNVEDKKDQNPLPAMLCNLSAITHACQLVPRSGRRAQARRVVSEAS